MAHIPFVPTPSSSKDVLGSHGEIVFFDGGEQQVIKALKVKTAVGKKLEDLEKVLKGCQCCMRSSMSCSTCPYTNHVDHSSYCWEALRDDIDAMIEYIEKHKEEHDA